MSAPAAPASVVPTLTESQYVSLYAPSIGEPGLHKTHSRISKKQWAKMVARQARIDALAVESMQATREDYAAKVAAGKIRCPSRLERLQAVAAGHPDNPSVQAARRLLAARTQDEVAVV